MQSFPTFVGSLEKEKIKASSEERYTASSSQSVYSIQGVYNHHES